MKSKRVASILGFALICGLSGCYDISSPEGILETAAGFLRKSDLSGLRGLLSGDARSAYGTPAGMYVLQTRLQGKRLKVSQGTVEAVVGDASDYTTTYLDSVDSGEADAAPLLQATIDCHSEDPAVSPIEGNTVGTASTACLITSIELR